MLDLVNAINGLDVNIAGELMPMPMPKIQNNSPTPVQLAPYKMHKTKR